MNNTTITRSGKWWLLKVDGYVVEWFATLRQAQACRVWMNRGLVN